MYRALVRITIGLLVFAVEVWLLDQFHQPPRRLRPLPARRATAVLGLHQTTVIPYLPAR